MSRQIAKLYLVSIAMFAVYRLQYRIFDESLNIKTFF
jgi:hypothetical protein